MDSDLPSDSKNHNQSNEQKNDRDYDADKECGVVWVSCDFRRPARFAEYFSCGIRSYLKPK